MGYTIIQGVGDGTTNTFSINFPLGFLSRSDVAFWVTSEVDGGGNPVYRPITWINDGLISIVTAPANGAAYEIIRTVSKTSLVHTYSNGEPIEEVNLDESNEQVMMAVQEVLDGRFSSPFAQNLNMGGNKITNLADGVAPHDAVTKEQLDAVAVLTGAGADSVATQAAAAALVSENNAEQSEDNAGVSETNAAASAATAASSLATLLASLVNYVTNSSLATTLAGYVTSSGLTSALSSYVTSSGLTSTLSAYAPLANPTFTGTPVLPTGTTGITQSSGDSSTKIATTAFVHSVVPTNPLMTPLAVGSIVLAVLDPAVGTLAAGGTTSAANLTVQNVKQSTAGGNPLVFVASGDSISGTWKALQSITSTGITISTLFQRVA